MLSALDRSLSPSGMNVNKEVFVRELNRMKPKTITTMIIVVSRANRNMPTLVRESLSVVVNSKTIHTNTMK